MRVAGVGPLELILCCIPLMMILGVVLLVALLRQPRTSPYGSPYATPPSSLPPAAPPAGWYADPLGNHEVRSWTGLKWTEHVADHGAQKVDPLEGP